MVKQVYLNGRFLTKTLTGVQRTAYEMVMALDNLIDNGVVSSADYTFTLIYSGDIINQILLKHITLEARGYLRGNLWEQFELPFYTRGKLLISMCSISSLFKRNQLLMVHDASTFVNKSYFSRVFRTWYNLAIPIIGNRSRRVITVSNFSKSELVNQGGIKPEKISVIYNAANHIFRYKRPSREFITKIERLKPYCLAVSSLAQNKNFDGLSRALTKVDISDYNVLVAGGVIDVLNRQVGQSENIIYLGYVSNAELRFLYKNASLFIFPSFYEGFGIPPLEAMASGCPVIASNTSSMPEILEDACDYFDPNDPVDMAHRIMLLLNNKDRLSQLRKKGYKRASMFNWENSGKQLYKLIQTCYE